MTLPNFRDPETLEKAMRVRQERRALGLPSLAQAKRLQKIVDKLAAIEALEKAKDQKQPDVAKEILSIMLLDTNPDDKEGRTYLECIGHLLIQRAIYGDDINCDINAIKLLFDRAYGRPAENGGIMKQVKKLFVGIEMMPDAATSLPEGK